MKHRVLRWPCLLLLAGGFVECAQAIDISPAPNGNGVSDVYESLYPGLVYDDDPLTIGTPCQPVREDMPHGGPFTNRQRATLGIPPTSGDMPIDITYASGTVNASGTVSIEVASTVIGKRYQLLTEEGVPLDEPDWITVEECTGTHVYKGKIVRTPTGAEIIGDGNGIVFSLAVTLVPGEPQCFSYTCLGDSFTDDDQYSDWEEAQLGTNPYVADEQDVDDDQLPDWWEKWVFGGMQHTGAGDDDAGGPDGMSNLTEFKLGFNPAIRDVEGMPRTLLTSATTATIAWEDSFTDETGFRVQRRVDTSSWSTLATAAANAVSFVDGAVPQAGFVQYRIAVVHSTGSTTYLPMSCVIAPDDSDGDTVADGTELHYGLNPSDWRDGWLDHDRDKIPSIFEIKKGADPRNEQDRPVADMLIDPQAPVETATVKRKIQTGINALPSNWSNPPWYVIDVRSGTYAEPISWYSKRVALISAATGTSEVRVESPNYGVGVAPYQDGVISGFVIAGSTASPGSAAIAFASSTPASHFVLDGCIVSGHNAQHYSYVNEGRILISHSTFLDNRDGASKFSLRLSGYYAHVEVLNSVLWNSGTSAESELPIYYQGTVRVSHSVVRGARPEWNAYTFDPVLSRRGLTRSDSAIRSIGMQMSGERRDIHGEPRSSQPDIGADQFLSRDGDNLPDWWELREFGHLAEMDTGDTDPGGADGASHWVEFALSTSPHMQDTELDGAWDGAEWAAQTDGLDRDTDDDFMLDGIEISTGLDPLSADDAMEDLDKDTYPNVYEAANGSSLDDPQSAPVAHCVVDPGVEVETSSAKRTISAALNAVPDYQAQPGSFYVVSVKSGTYAEQAGFYYKQVMLRGEPNGGPPPVIKPGEGYSAVYFGESGGSCLDGFLIERGGTGAPSSSCGVYLDESRFNSLRCQISNCTIRNFDAWSSGAGAWIYRGKLALLNCSLIDNSASYGGRAAQVDPEGSLYLGNSIVWNPLGSASSQIALSGSTSRIEIDNSIVLGGEWNALALDPKLHPYQRLLPISPAIGAANANATSRDLYGNPRDASPDIGAEEFFSSDGDALPDWWERTWLGNLSSSEHDDSESPPPLDRLTNFYELLFGTNPLVADTNSNGKDDRFEAAHNIAHPNYPDEWLADLDADYLLAGLELLHGSSDSLADTNGDGVWDIVALYAGIDLLSLDIDVDSIDNATERARGLNPWQQDSDGDEAADNIDAYPLDSARSTIVQQPGDTTPPDITLIEPSNANPLP